MGTNYYTREKVCKYCGGGGDEIHLGKSSAGWRFTFNLNGRQYYKSIKEMKEWLRGRRIYDEYGDRVSKKIFWSFIKVKQSEPQRSNEYIIIDGYNFVDYEFS